uniref:uncharacterized protein LOC105940625 n=1 Tax=Maylandia zebra TaxID=106582 RepID=UPI000D325B4C|nr:uncharacterized protein LOC105940625 [Maylandia zebra]
MERIHQRPETMKIEQEPELSCVFVKSDRSKEPIVVFQGSGSPSDDESDSSGPKPGLSTRKTKGRMKRKSSKLYPTEVKRRKSSTAHKTHHKPDVPEPELEAEPRCVSVKSDRSKEAIVVFKGSGSPAVEK